MKTAERTIMTVFCIILAVSSSYGEGPEDTDIFHVPPSLINQLSLEFSPDQDRGTSLSSLLGPPRGADDVLQISAAFLTNLLVHEAGHEVVAHHVGAEGSRLNFFEKQGGDFFLGTSSVGKIDSRSRLPYAMGGEFFADLTFEHALRSFRKNPNTYNTSLMVASGTDFLWYCIYSFYVSSDNASYDPVAIADETGLSRDTLFAIVLAKTMINGYRVLSGDDPVVPIIRVDRHSASINFMIPFDLGS